MKLKLMQLPHGTNRNRTSRRPAEWQDEEVDLAELDRLFRRFWRRWKSSARADGAEVAA